MAWTGTVTNVTKETGLLLVTVRYTDGVKILDETYKSYGEPDADWIPLTVKNRVAQLDGVESVTIPTGTVAEPKPVDTELPAFWANMRKLERVKLLVDMGALSKEDKKVTDLVAAIAAKLTTYWDKI